MTEQPSLLALLSQAAARRTAEQQAASSAPPVLAPDHVLAMVEAQDARVEQPRTLGNRDGLTHLSSLLNVCPREHVIARRFNISRPEQVTGGHRIVWKFGRAIEDHVRSSIIDARARRGVFGAWTCVCGHARHVGFHPPSATCPACRKGLDHYREPEVIDPNSGVIGSPDITLVENGWYLPVEIKSMNKEDFDKLTRPVADHALQVLGYHRLLHLLGYRMFPEARLIYVRKEFLWGGRNRVYKEYSVRPEDHAAQIDAMLQAGGDIQAHLRAGSTPDRIGGCHSATCSRARSCSVSDVCWSL